MSVQSSRVAVPRLYIPPPVPAVSPMSVQSMSATVPALYSPPPAVAVPPVMVRPVIVADTPIFTCNTRPVPPTIVRPADGPVMEFGPPLPVSTNAPDVRLMVWAVAKAVELKVIEALPDWTFARLTAARRSSSPGGAPSPSVATATTSGTVVAWKAPMSTGESSPNPRSSVVSPGIAIPLPRATLPFNKAMVCVGPP